VRRFAYPLWNLNAVVALVALVSLASANSQVRPMLKLLGSEDLNSSGTIEFHSDGRIRSWDFEPSTGRPIQLFDPSERLLLALDIRLSGRDITDEIVWQAISNTTARHFQFTGQHRQSGFRVQRTYWLGNNKHVLHTIVRFDFENVINEDQFEAILMIPNAMTQHISNDNSLGDYFYGIRKTYFSNSGGSYTLYDGNEGVFVDSIAFSSRHIGLRVLQANASSIQKIHLSPSSPATIHRNIPLGARTQADEIEYSIELKLVARSLISSSIRNTEFEPMLYGHMWKPLRILAQFVERTIQAFQSMTGSLGIAVIVFALLLRSVLLPISVWSIRQQTSFSIIQEAMAPKIDEINAEFKGAEKSERTLELYKEYGVSPFTGLKGTAALFVQLPILVVFFAITTESALFRDIPFLWFDDLSLPDRTFRLPFAIPGIGGYVNFMPIILAIVSVLASIVQKHSAVGSALKFSGGAMLMVLMIVVFFYSCASALVLYWTTANIAQIFEGEYVRRRDNSNSNVANNSSCTN